MRGGPPSGSSGVTPSRLSANRQHESRAELRSECSAEPRLDCSPELRLDPSVGALSVAGSFSGIPPADNSNIMDDL
jgi:hypothetical protein